MTQHPSDRRDDLLDHVAGLLERMADGPGEAAAEADADRARFCRDMSDWVRAVRDEMAQLCADFERSIRHDQIAQNAANAADRLGGHASSLAERVREAIPSRPNPVRFLSAAGEAAADDGSEASEPTLCRASTAAEASGETTRTDDHHNEGDRADAPAHDAPAHVASAEAIRSDVASFRERLRAQRAEAARQAADERRRFVESIRRNRGTAAGASATPAPNSSTSDPEPERSVAEAGMTDAEPFPGSRSGLGPTGGVDGEPLGEASDQAGGEAGGDPDAAGAGLETGGNADEAGRPAIGEVLEEKGRVTEATPAGMPGEPAEPTMRERPGAASGAAFAQTQPDVAGEATPSRTDEASAGPESVISEPIVAEPSVAEPVVAEPVVVESVAADRGPAASADSHGQAIGSIPDRGVFETVSFGTNGGGGSCDDARPAVPSFARRVDAAASSGGGERDGAAPRPGPEDAGGATQTDDRPREGVRFRRVGDATGPAPASAPAAALTTGPAPLAGPSRGAGRGGVLFRRTDLPTFLPASGVDAGSGGGPAHAGSWASDAASAGDAGPVRFRMRPSA